MPTNWKHRGKGKLKSYRCAVCEKWFYAGRHAWLCSARCRKAWSRNHQSKPPGRDFKGI